jgi:tRNA wybutosine-synthesizing protein 1
VAVWHDHRLLILGLAILVLGSLLIYSRSIQRLQYRQEPQFPLPEKTLEDFGKAARPKSGSYEELKGRGDVSRVVNDDQKNKIAVAPRPRLAARRVRGSKTGRPLESPGSSEPKAGVLPYRIQPLVFFSSLTGNTETCARKLVTDLAASLNQAGTASFAEPTLHDLSYVDYDDFFITPPTSEGDTRYVYLLLLPTYNIDTILNNFLAHLQETHHDFRIDTAPLSGLLGYSVFGFGDREGWPTEEEGFCSQAKDVDKWLAKLTGGKRAFPLGMGDTKSDAQQRLDEWRQGVEEVLRTIRSTGNLGEGVLGSGDAIESDNEDDELDEHTSTKSAEPGQPRRKARTTPKPSILEDLEDLGRKAPIPIDFTVERPSPTTSLAAKPMVPTTSPTYTALTKQGYTIIGSHSGVKICRWTKSALRGRGSCYKHSFYGIASHLCMETTPSLSCSNKCVFCWRHGTNPVGTTWRWQIDPPDMILEGAMAAHYQKIKMMRGVPGVRAERFQEAMRIRHCALSLVGEPIFYPHINEFVDLLHKQHISSFLVCNAQHPDQLAALKPVTQLYVSIDASNRDSLRKIDRPLHRDFWERFLRCLDILRERRFSMRTVFRLTLVKGFNIDDEVEGYADLVARGLPCFVEVKGVTYCGTSSSSSAGLTMQNVPFYTEVVAFVTALDKALEKRGLQYGIAAEHAHSCCVLLASKRFFIEGKWHTLIDYDAFFKCLERGEEFRPEDYTGEPTPEWACWGRGGFDPTDQRVDRKGRPLVQELKVGLLEEAGTVLEARDDDES